MFNLPKKLTGVERKKMEHCYTEVQQYFHFFVQRLAFIKLIKVLITASS
jgi:hypothetical protein